MQNNKPLPPVLFFIFGGSGDLNHRKLTPALYNLFLDGSMPGKFNITGIARKEFNDESYKKNLLEGIEKFSRRKDENNKWNDFASRLGKIANKDTNFDFIVPAVLALTQLCGSGIPKLTVGPAPGISGEGSIGVTMVFA